MSHDPITTESPVLLTSKSFAKSFAEHLLPKFEIVSNLKELERIEVRQKSLGSVTKEILKSRDLAHQNVAPE
ncbi:MAG: hypothetical protein HYX67_02925 [Candidatus Melainabacteria bacterium]|nr:hypothetical protein [Candidatus Melainabacteria bacterium]